MLFLCVFQAVSEGKKKKYKLNTLFNRKKCKFWNMTAKTRFSWSSQCWRARHDDFKMFSDKFYDESLGLAVIAYRLWSALLVGDRGGPKRSLGRNCWFARDVKAAMLVITGIKVFFSSGNLTPFPCKFFITWFVVLITNIRHFRKYHNYILVSPPTPHLPHTPPPPPKKMHNHCCHFLLGRF